MPAEPASPQPQLSCLFITFNRSHLLRRTLTLIRNALQEPRLSVEYIIADDASSADHFAVATSLNPDRLVVAPTNGGLGSNCNRGLAACRSSFVLQLQDDWDFVGDEADIRKAFTILDGDPEIGVVNFLPPPYALPGQRRVLRGLEYYAFENDGMNATRSTGDRPYSDRPHMKRREFVEDLGPYREGVPMTSMELEFQRRVACQLRWRIAWLVGPEIFQHSGSENTFNPGQLKARRLERLYRVPVLGPLYRAARTTARKWLRPRQSDDRT